MSRNVVLFIATSLDGYIARKNGDLDWLFAVHGDGDNGYLAFYETMDTVIMGKATYDQILEMEKGRFPYPDKKCYVFTTNPDVEDTEFVEFVREDVATFVQMLKQQAGSNIWIVGGAELLDHFLKAKVVDELNITIMPILLGSGIALFKVDIPEVRLDLKETRQYGQVVQLHYKVQRSGLGSDQ